MGNGHAPIDAAILDSIADRFRTDESVSDVELTLGDVDGHQRLVITFDPERYPDRVVNTRIEVQWYRNDGFNVHYVETHADGETWQCRWDRQRNPHNERGHFHLRWTRTRPTRIASLRSAHPPPDAADPVDVEYPDDYRDVLSAIRVVIRNRIEASWDRQGSP